MKNFRRFSRKSYAMKRMAGAIDRAIHAASSVEKERSARWAAAWGLLCGINTNAARLRMSEVQDPPALKNRRASDQGQEPAAAPSDPIMIPPAEPIPLLVAEQASALAMPGFADTASGALTHSAASIFAPPGEGEAASAMPDLTLPFASPSDGGSS